MKFLKLKLMLAACLIVPQIAQAIIVINNNSHDLSMVLTNARYILPHRFNRYPRQYPGMVDATPIIIKARETINYDIDPSLVPLSLHFFGPGAQNGSGRSLLIQRIDYPIHRLHRCGTLQNISNTDTIIFSDGPLAGHDRTSPTLIFEIIKSEVKDAANQTAASAVPSSARVAAAASPAAPTADARIEAAAAASTTPANEIFPTVPGGPTHVLPAASGGPAGTILTAPTQETTTSR